MKDVPRAVALVIVIAGGAADAVRVVAVPEVTVAATLAAAVDAEEGKVR